MAADPGDQEDGRAAAELIAAGGDLVGGLAGAAIALLGGPAGAFGGAALAVAVGHVLRHIGGELRQRALGPRGESVREPHWPSQWAKCIGDY